MAKRIEINGKFYRKRKGKLVQIPDEWVGQTLHPQTKKERRSKQSASVRREPHRTFKDGTVDNNDYRRRKNDYI